MTTAEKRINSVQWLSSIFRNKLAPLQVRTSPQPPSPLVSGPVMLQAWVDGGMGGEVWGQRVNRI